MASIQELMDHFNWRSPQAAIKYINKHLAEINRDGEHARHVKGCWEIDEIGVKRLEELRGFGIEQVMEGVESQRNRELAATVTNLQTRLTAALVELADNQKQLVDIMRESKDNAVRAAVAEEKMKDQQREIDRLNEFLFDAAQEKYEMRQHLNRLKSELESRKWWQFWK